LRTNFFKDWKEIPLVALFEERFHLPTKLYHDPDCLLYYHLKKEPCLAGKNNGIVIRIDDGIGMSRLVDGKLYEPKSDTSCELGHTIAIPNGRFCACGKKGCLETYASLRGMPDIYFEKTGKDDFLNGLQLGEPTAKEILQNAAACLGVSIANLFTLSAPEFILLDGILFSQAPYFFDLIKKNTVEQLKYDCELLFAAYKSETPAIGACLITTEKNAKEILFTL
jgi:glucokinase